MAEEINIEEYIEFNAEQNFEKEIAEHIKEEQCKQRISSANAALKKEQEYSKSLLDGIEFRDKNNEELKLECERLQKVIANLEHANEELGNNISREQEYSRSLLDGIKFRDERLAECRSDLEKEPEYSKSLMDGIVYRDGDYKKLQEEISAEQMKKVEEGKEQVLNSLNELTSSVKVLEEAEIERKNRWRIFKG